jgi:hypothetical protein
MKYAAGIVFVLIGLLQGGLDSQLFAYNGRATVTKQTEDEHGIHFEVSFQEQNGLLSVTLTAPRKVKTLALSGISLAQVDRSDETTLRVPVSSAPWKLEPDDLSPERREKPRITVAEGFPRHVKFSVSPKKLPETKLEVRYGGFDSGWTYIVDLSSYRSKTKPALARETTIKDADKAATLTESLGIKKINAATVIDSPYGFSNYRVRTTTFVTDQKTLGALHKVLGKFPAKGGVFKSWPKDIRHRIIYLHTNDPKVISLNIYGHSLQSPLDATYSAPEDDPHSTELMKLLVGIDQNAQSQRFRDRPGPLSKPRESSWRPTNRDRDKIIAAVKAFESEEPSIGDSEDWQWDDAEIYVDKQGNYLLWVFFRSRNRGKVWMWVELDSKVKRIETSGWGAG